METPYLSALDTCCIIRSNRVDIGKIQGMRVLPSFGQGWKSVVRSMGHNAVDSLISVRHLGNGGWDPLH
eukprot:9366924-Ditylum_brightwellii.AAC.1